MKSVGLAILVAAVLLVAPPRARAEEAIEVEASIGLQGYVAPYQTTNLTVRVTADVLFVGDLRVTIGSVNLFTAIEVPAGGSKEYVLAVPAAGASSRALVQLFAEGSQDHLVQASVSVLSPGNQLLVGVVGAAGLEPALVASGSVPFDRPLTILHLSPVELTGDLAPLSYIVVGEGSLAAARPEVIGAIGGWVSEGGRIVGTIADLQRIEGSAGPAVALTGEATAATLGAGELLVVDDLSSIRDWGAIIRDVPPLSLTTNEFAEEEFGFQMIEAASAGAESVAPGIPWLLAALAVYVLLVGPVNFMILRRWRRPELAWITIPAVSLVMLATLWVAGRSQLDDRIVTHASIVVQDEDGSRARSSMIVVAGGEGEHTLDVPANWSVTPLDVSMMFGRGTRMEARVGPGPAGGTRLGFELPNLGAATVSATWNPAPIPLRAAVEADDAGVTATMFNDSGLGFWAWGIGDGSAAKAAPGPLDPGQSGSVTLQPGVGFSQGGGVLADAVLSQGDWDWELSGPDPWQRVWPLSEAMFRQEARLLQSGPYFFGFTNDLVAEVAVDGSAEQAHGPALVVIPLDVPAFTGSATGAGEILQIVGADFVDGYPGWVYASGADALELRFRVPPGAVGNAKILSQGGRLPGVEALEVYNWEAARFDEYPWPGDFPVDSHVSPTNELMVRIVLTGGDFSDMELPTGSLTVSVESSP